MPKKTSMNVKIGFLNCHVSETIFRFNVPKCIRGYHKFNVGNNLLTSLAGEILTVKCSVLVVLGVEF